MLRLSSIHSYFLVVTIKPYEINLYLSSVETREELHEYIKEFYEDATPSHYTNYEQVRRKDDPSPEKDGILVLQNHKDQTKIAFSKCGMP